MKKITLLAAAAIGIVAFWRKDHLKDDVAKAGDAVKSAGEKIRSRGDDADQAEDETEDVDAADNSDEVVEDAATA